MRVQHRARERERQRSNAYEVLAGLSDVHGVVDLGDEPVEHVGVDKLGQRVTGVGSLSHGSKGIG